MAVNNEIGVIQPIKEIGKMCRYGLNSFHFEGGVWLNHHRSDRMILICRERKIYFHTDAAQAVGKIPMDVDAMNIDLMSISGHKVCYLDTHFYFLIFTP
jgi:cysteine desulfurase